MALDVRERPAVGPTAPPVRHEASPVRDVASPAAGTRWRDLASRHGFTLIVVAAVAARLPLLGLPLTFEEDIWRQADTASIARNLYLGGFDVLHPRIDWGGAGSGAVEAEMPLYPLLVAFGYRLVGHVDEVVGQLVSLGMLVVTLVAFGRLAARLLPRRAALLATGALAFAPLLIRHSVTFMPESTLLAACCVALLAFVRWLERPSPGLGAALAAALAVAGLVKPTGLMVGLVVAGVLLVGHRHLLRQPGTWAIAAVALAGPVAWLVHAHGIYLDTGNTFGVLSFGGAGDTKFGDLQLWQTGEFWAGLGSISLPWAFGVVALPLWLLGVAVAARERYVHLLLVSVGAVAALAYLLLVGRYAGGSQGIQYHVPTLPFVALGVGVGAEAVWELAEDRWWRHALVLRGTVVVLGIAYLVVGLATVRHIVDASTDAPLACARSVAATVAPGELVAVASDDPSRDGEGKEANYQQPMVFYWGGVKGWSVPIDRLRPDVLLGLRDQGARWLVLPSGATASTPALAEWLDGLARPVGRDDCVVARLPAA
jgi:4-amino-4-deoxy-L-arabinose transferase-like glycosyltransferase